MSYPVETYLGERDTHAALAKIDAHVDELLQYAPASLHREAVFSDDNRNHFRVDTEGGSNGNRQHGQILLTIPAGNQGAGPTTGTFRLRREENRGRWYFTTPLDWPRERLQACLQPILTQPDMPEGLQTLANFLNVSLGAKKPNRTTGRVTTGLNDEGALLLWRAMEETFDQNQIPTYYTYTYRTPEGDLVYVDSVLQTADGRMPEAQLTDKMTHVQMKDEFEYYRQIIDGQLELFGFDEVLHDGDLPPLPRGMQQDRYRAARVEFGDGYRLVHTDPDDRSPLSAEIFDTEAEALVRADLLYRRRLAQSEQLPTLTPHRLQRVITALADIVAGARLQKVSR